MSLTTLLLAALPVALLFLGAALLTWRRRLPRAAVAVTVAEAVVVTLLAALWFGSLGHGGWLLVFGLVGVLVSGAERGLRFAFLRSAKADEALAFAIGVARYVAAGALLSWRLT